MFFKQSKFHRFSRKNTHLMGRKMNANVRFWEAKHRRAGGVAWSRGKEHLFRIGIFPKTWGDLQSSQTYSPSETLHNKRFPIPKIALIREKATQLFREYFILVLIYLSGAESTQKITANSTYWEAKLKGAGGVARSGGNEPLF